MKIVAKTIAYNSINSVSSSSSSGLVQFAELGRQLESKGPTRGKDVPSPWRPFFRFASRRIPKLRTPVEVGTLAISAGIQPFRPSVIIKVVWII